MDQKINYTKCGGTGTKQNTVQLVKERGLLRKRRRHSQCGLDFEERSLAEKCICLLTNPFSMKFLYRAIHSSAEVNF